MVQTRSSTLNEYNNNDEFHDSQEEIDLTEDNENVSLGMIYSQLKLYRSELLTKIDNVKDDILTQLQNENQCLKGEIIELKKELDTKSGKIDQIESELEHVKKTLQHKVHLSEFTEVERDVIDLQQYIRLIRD